MAVSSPMEVRMITPRAFMSIKHHGECLPRLTRVFAIIVELLDLVTNLAIGDFDIVLGGAIIQHEGEEAVIGDIELCIY